MLVFKMLIDAPQLSTTKKRRESKGIARVNQVTSASLRHPLSVFNKNSTLKNALFNFTGTAVSPISGQQNKATHTEMPLPLYGKT